MRLLIFILLAYVLYRILRGLIAPALKTKSGDDEGIVDVMVQDPSCQTYIPMRGAKRKVIEGKEYYFCSKECCEKFEHETKTRGRI
jgi:YHS domain-containing protein